MSRKPAAGVARDDDDDLFSFMDSAGR